MILQEDARKEYKSNDSMILKVPNEETQYSLTRHWEVIDKVIHADGRVEEFTYYNTVVDSCSKLIACLMKGQAGYNGILYWAVGSGDSSWSNSNPPSPSTSTTKLVNEIGRKRIDPNNIVFIDANNNVTQNITNRLQISITFEEGEMNGEWREFGLFGGNATGTKDTGIMINHKIHPLIYKTSGIRVERTIRLTF